MAQVLRRVRARPATPRARHERASGSANRDEVIAIVEAAFADGSPSRLLARLAEVGIPAGKVRTLDEVYDWDQTRRQGLLVDVEHPLLGGIELPGPPLRFDDNAYAGGRSEHLHPPLLGEHNDSVRAWLDEQDGAAGADGPDRREGSARGVSSTSTAQDLLAGSGPDTP